MVFQILVKKNLLPELTIKIIKNKIINANVLTVANNKEPHEETNRGPDMGAWFERSDYISYHQN